MKPSPPRLVDGSSSTVTELRTYPSAYYTMPSETRGVLSRPNPVTGDQLKLAEKLAAQDRVLSSLELLGVRAIRRGLAWLACSSFLSGAAEAAVLVLLSNIALAASGSTGSVDLLWLTLPQNTAVVVAFGLVAVRLIGGVLTARTVSALSTNAQRVGRETVVKRYFSATWATQSEASLGEVQQLLTVHSDRLASTVMSLGQGLSAALNLAALLMAALYVAPLAALSALTVGSALFIGLRPLNILTKKAARDQVFYSRRLAIISTEYTRLSREFRIFGVERSAVGRLLGATADAASFDRRMRLLSQLTPHVYQAAAVAVVLGGLSLVVDGQSRDLAAIGATLLLMMRSLAFGQVVQIVSQQLSEYGAFLHDLRMRIDQFETGRRGGQLGEPSRLFDIKCNDVTFSYRGGSRAIEAVSFSVENGESLGIVGRSGSGKSTLSQLLLGMRSPDTGEVRVGGLLAEDLLQRDGSRYVALVAQEPLLLQGTIRETVAFFRDCASGDVEAACAAVGVHEEVLALPFAYETQVGDGGSALSGGQRQRLAIARALLGQPKLLVLDEPTSALDARSESLVRATLASVRGQVTVVIISHRLAAIESCDKLAVLENGKLVDFGPASEVRGRSPFSHVREEVGGGRSPVGKR